MAGRSGRRNIGNFKAWAARLQLKWGRILAGLRPAAARCARPFPLRRPGRIAAFRGGGGRRIRPVRSALGVGDLPPAVDAAVGAGGMRQLGAAAAAATGRMHRPQLVGDEPPALPRPRKFLLWHCAHSGKVPPGGFRAGAGGRSGLMMGDAPGRLPGRGVIGRAGWLPFRDGVADGGVLAPGLDARRNGGGGFRRPFQPGLAGSRAASAPQRGSMGPAAHGQLA